jgi:hypothetical protein
VSVDNYRLTLVDLKNVGHKDDSWVLANHVAHVFLCTRSRNWETRSCFYKTKNCRVENVEDNDEDVNQFEEMTLFTNRMNIKHMEKDFDKNLMPYMWKGGNEKFVWKLCITFHINVGIYLYEFKFISYFLPILNVSLSYAVYRSSFLFVSSHSRAIILKTKLKIKFIKQH